MRITETKPRKGADILAGADFADAWRIEGIGVGQSAETIAGRLPFATPWWAKALMSARNALVAPLGLKGGHATGRAGRPAFPVLASRPERVVLGLDDKHLDFRLVIEMEARGPAGLAAVATTYVRTHNRGGRLYLAAVKPFHRLIVPAMLARAAAGLS